MSRYALVAVLALSATMVGACKKQPPPEPAPAPAPTVEAPPPAPEPDASDVEERELDRVFFEFDSTDFRGESLEALENNVADLQAFPETRVEVQGHADERGTTEYNLALGQRRAERVKDRMVRMGISGGRMTTISYGEERPLVRASNPDAWAKNRRAEFRVISSGPNEPIEGTVR